MSKSLSSPPLRLWLIVAALLLATALASHNMSHDFLWWDETISTQIAGTGINGPLLLSQIWHNASADPWHPPGFFLLLNGWARLFGASQFSLRLFPFLTGILTLAWTYRLGVWTGGRRVGLAALVILSGAAYFLDMMTELRPYMMYALFGVMSVALYWRLRSGKAQRERPDLMTFSMSILGLLYAHYFASLIVAVLAGYHLLFTRRDRQWWRIATSALIGALLFVPWLVVFATAVRISTGNQRFDALNTGDFLRLLADGISNGVLPFLLVLVPGIVVAWRSGSGRFLLWLFGLYLVLALIVNQWLHLLTHLRYIIALWGGAAVVAGYGVVWLRRQPSFGKLLVAALVIAWWSVAAYQTLTPDFRNRMFREQFISFFRPNLPLYDALRTIQPKLQADDIVLYDAPDSPWAVSGAFDYYTGDWTIS
ncbi:MAG: glycosyltransferase family 39 protein, partial [Chloroflexota bacterium]